jgi:hypothetical protein
MAFNGAFRDALGPAGVRMGAGFRRVNPGAEYDIQNISLRRWRGHRGIVDSTRVTEYCATLSQDDI